MKIGALQFPEQLLSALRQGDLVVFAGAGVSMSEPAKLPSFAQMANLIAEGTGEVPHVGEPEDRFLGRLQHKGIDVHARAAQLLRREGLAPTALHQDLLRLYRAPEDVRLVTTNFDELFDLAAESVFGQVPEVFRAPALPRGHRFNGIVHMHGAIARHGDMVLTDADFGRAYLTEGWARRFLVELFHHYTVLFVGYSHNDVIVSYLARALPESEVSHRFALTHQSDDPHRWQVLGIEPIAYPTSSEHDHGMLYDGVRRLADSVRRSILDWQRELTALASRPPPIDEEEADTVELALTREETTRFFTNAARLPAWISWLDGRGKLDSLFRDVNLNGYEDLLAQWLAEHFMTAGARELFVLIAKHGTCLNPRVWRILSAQIAMKRQPLDDDLLSRWMCVLLATLPAEIDDFILLSLGQQCARRGMIVAALRVFAAMAANRLVLKPAIPWPDDERSEEQTGIDVEITLGVEHYYLNKLWAESLRPNLAQIAEPLLSEIVRGLEDQYFTLRAWQKASREWDATSWRRHAIEPHQQDQYPTPIDVLIDAARDSLEWLATHQASAAACWTERLAACEVPLVCRLAVHAVGARSDLSPDDKIEWLLAHVGLHDSVTHHEVHRAVALVYAAANPESRRTVIDAVLTYRWPHDEDTDQGWQTARHQFEWLHWLHSAAPDCQLTQQALDEVSAKYPDLKPSEQPDLTHWLTGGKVGPTSPWTTQELLAKPAAEWLPDLLSFQPTEFLGPDHPGLVLSIAEAAKTEFQWALDLAVALADAKEWSSDLWSGLIRAWSSMDLDESGQREVLKWLGRADLHATHARVIADALNSLVRSPRKPYVIGILADANRIASAVWNRLDRNEPLEPQDDWLLRAINHPAGILAQFWLGSLSIWRSHQQPTPDILGDDYRRALTHMVKDESLSGILSRSVLASQVTYLFAADEQWTRSHLLPLFDAGTSSPDFLAAWDGFLVWGRLNPPVAEAMEGAFLAAVARFSAESAPRRDRFVEHYTVMLGYFARDPLNTWVPALFQYVDVVSRRLFASNIEGHLRQMDEAQQGDWWRRWLKAYWERRLQGVPAPLKAGEIERMLEWLPHLRGTFPDAVALAVQMPPTAVQHSSILFELGESELPRLYPEAVAQLLIYLGQSESPPYVRHGWDKVITAIGQSALAPDLRGKLAELAARLGLNAPPE